MLMGSREHPGRCDRHSLEDETRKAAGRRDVEELPGQIRSRYNQRRNRARALRVAPISFAFAALMIMLPARHSPAWAGGDKEAADFQVPLPPPVEALAVVSELRPTGRHAYIALLMREAEARRLPPALADAVAYVESAYNPGAVGAVGEVGIMHGRDPRPSRISRRAVRS
jgi:soluble lytic murein transglycosylase-like protein